MSVCTVIPVMKSPIVVCPPLHTKLLKMVELQQVHLVRGTVVVGVVVQMVRQKQIVSDVPFRITKSAARMLTRGNAATARAALKHPCATVIATICAQTKVMDQ